MAQNKPPTLLPKATQDEFRSNEDFHKISSTFLCKGLAISGNIRYNSTAIEKEVQAIWPNVLAVARVSRSVSRFLTLIVGATVPGTPMSSA